MIGKELPRALRTGGASAALLGAVLLLSAPRQGLGQWPQWRGAARDGSVSASTRSPVWPPQLRLVWEREIGGGYSGPVVADGRIWVHARVGGKEVVSCLALDTGQTLWSRGYDAPFTQDPSAQEHGLGPYSTPAVAEGRLLTLGMTSVLTSWENETGRLLWRRDYSEELDPSYQYFGTALSPLVWGDLCFVQFGGLNRLGDPPRGFTVALDLADGGERWRWDGDAPAGGASPIIHRIGSRWHLVFKSMRSIVGVDPRTGEQLWRVPFKVTEDNTIVTPLIVGERLFTSDWQKGVSAWRFEPVGDSWTAQELWTTRKASLFMSSPVVSRDQVVGFSHLRKGQLFGLDPATGEVLWLEGSRWGEHASLVGWGDDVLVFLEDGSLVVGQVAPDRFRTLRRYRLGHTRSWAHPAVAYDRIIIRDGTRIAVFRVGDP